MTSFFCRVINGICIHGSMVNVIRIINVVAVWAQARGHSIAPYHHRYGSAQQYLSADVQGRVLFCGSILARRLDARSSGRASIQQHAGGWTQPQGR